MNKIVMVVVVLIAIFALLFGGYEMMASAEDKNYAGPIRFFTGIVSFVAGIGLLFLLHEIHSAKAGKV